MSNRDKAPVTCSEWAERVRRVCRSSRGPASGLHSFIHKRLDRVVVAISLVLSSSLLSGNSAFSGTIINMGATGSATAVFNFGTTTATDTVSLPNQAAYARLLLPPAATLSQYRSSSAATVNVSAAVLTEVDLTGVDIVDSFGGIGHAVGGTRFKILSDYGRTGPVDTSISAVTVYDGRLGENEALFVDFEFQIFDVTDNALVTIYVFDEVNPFLPRLINPDLIGGTLLYDHEYVFALSLDAGFGYPLLGTTGPPIAGRHFLEIGYNIDLTLAAEGAPAIPEPNSAFIWSCLSIIGLCALHSAQTRR